MATTHDKIQWIIDYTKFPFVSINKETSRGLTGNDFIDCYWYLNEFGMLMIKIESIEIGTHLIAEFVIPDTEADFIQVMKLLKINLS